MGYQRDAVVSAVVFVATTLLVTAGTIIGFRIHRATTGPILFDDFVFVPVVVCGIVAVAAIAMAVTTRLMDREQATPFQLGLVAKLHAVPVGVYGACTLMVSGGDAASVVNGVTFAIGTTIHLSWLRHALGKRRHAATKRRSAGRLVAESALVVAAFILVSSWLTATQEPAPVPSPVVIHTRASAQADLDAEPGIAPVLPVEIPRDYHWEGLDRHEREGSRVVARSSTFEPWSEEAQLPTVRVCAREVGRASCLRGQRPVERTVDGLEVTIAFLGSHPPSEEDVTFWTTVPLTDSLAVAWLEEE